jgi:hypothetical protein
MPYLIAIVAALAVQVASAIETPKPAAPPAAPAAQKPADTPPADAPEEKPPPAADAEQKSDAEPKADAEPEEEETLPPLPPDAVPAGPPPARFTPTEKVRADFPVSFPIDI